MTKKIVIFEDDAFLLDAYKLRLSADAEWQTEMFADGEDALNRVKTAKPDIIILDLLMPKQSGMDILKELHANSATKSVPVIVASNLDQKSTIEEAIALGAKDYFVKSEATITDILEKCKKVLRK